MNDQELTTAVRKSVDGARMSVPEEQITSRGRAIRGGRRGRLAAGTAAVATAGAAAIAAALVLAGSAGPAGQQAQDTAYVVSHVTRALDAVPANTIFYMRTNWAPHSVVTDMWASGRQRRTETFRAGKLTDDNGSTGTSTSTSVSVNYQDRTWSRSTQRLGPLSARAPAWLSCKNGYDLPIFSNASWMAAELRIMVSCGLLKDYGTATAGGVTAIRLATPGAKGGATWYVSPATYLPVRETITVSRSLRLENDFQWLPPTTANLARLSLPAAPRGFAQLQP